MSNKLELAVQCIKGGDRSEAQRLLAEVLVQEPDNEQGWLWLAAVLSELPRRYCIHQVLQINPGNQKALYAWQALEMEADEISARLAGSQSAVSPAAVVGTTLDGAVNPDLLEGVEASMAGTLSRRPVVQMEILKRDILPEELLKSLKAIDLAEITEVSQNRNIVSVIFKNGKTQQQQLVCASEKMAIEVLNFLAKKLGPRFERRILKVPANGKILASFVLFILIAAITMIFYLGAMEVAAGNRALHLGDWADSMVGAIGPIGVLGIGGILMLVVFISMIRQYLHPDKITKLVLDESINS